MLSQWWTKFTHTALLLLILFTLHLPQTVVAAPGNAPAAEVTVHFDVMVVKANDSVTIRTRDFPVRTRFIVRMDKAGKRGVNGMIAGEFNSASGGIFDQTFAIPAALKDEVIIAIRIESPDGYAADNWFFNRDQNYLPPDPKKQPTLTFSEVKKNQTVAIEASNLPPNTRLWVRIGPYATFYRDYITAESVQTNAEGAAKFTLSVPKTGKDADYIAVRVDGGGKYVFAVYKNIDGGTAAKPGEYVKINPCNIVAIAPVPTLGLREDFDAVWTVQNAGLSDWTDRKTVYRWTGGSKLHKREDVNPVGFTVKRGEVLDVAVDMIAPDQPGYYTTQWSIISADQTVCTLNIGVYVVQK